MAGINFKALTQFQKFDWEAFATGKKFVFVRVDPLMIDNGEGTTPYLAGSKLYLEIDEDNTQYRANKRTGEVPTNEGVTFAVKVMGVNPSSYEGCVKHMTEIKLGDVQRCVLYGDFSNELSLTVGEAYPVED